MSRWNYRVARRTWAKEGWIEFGIHQVYYHEDGRPASITEGNVGISGETLAELKDDYLRYAGAFSRPVLDYDTLAEIEAGG